MGAAAGRGASLSLVPPATVAVYGFWLDTAPLWQRLVRQGVSVAIVRFADVPERETDVVDSVCHVILPIVDLLQPDKVSAGRPVLALPPSTIQRLIQTAIAL